MSSALTDGSDSRYFLPDSELWQEYQEQHMQESDNDLSSDDSDSRYMLANNSYDEHETTDSERLFDSDDSDDSADEFNDELDFNNQSIKWSKFKSDFVSKPNENNFEIKPTFRPHSRPVDYFLELFDESLIERIHTATNMYGVRKYSIKNEEKVSLQEIYAFLGKFKF